MTAQPSTHRRNNTITLAEEVPRTMHSLPRLVVCPKSKRKKKRDGTAVRPSRTETPNSPRGNIKLARPAEGEKQNNPIPPPQEINARLPYTDSTPASSVPLRPIPAHLREGREVEGSHVLDEGDLLEQQPRRGGDAGHVGDQDRQPRLRALSPHEPHHENLTVTAA